MIWKFFGIGAEKDLLPHIPEDVWEGKLPTIEVGIPLDVDERAVLKLPCK